MRRYFLVLGLLITAMVVAACGGTAETPEPEVIEREVVVTQIVEVEGEPVVEEVTITEVVTATPEPVDMGPKTLIVCMAQEPNGLGQNESALVTSAVLEAVQPPVYDAASFQYQPQLVEKLPSFDDGDAVLEEVTISEGDTFYDVASDAVLTLTAGMTETFSLNQLEGDPLEVSEYDGGDLTTVQTTAQWTLIEGLEWEDGTPLTADDSVFYFEVVGDPDWPSSKYTYDRTASYTALDDRTIEWVSLPGYTDGLYFTNIWVPQPRHQLGSLSAAEMLEDAGVQRSPLAYGPYKIDEWISGDRIVLSPNPTYWGGEPPLDQLIYRFIGDSNQLIAQLAAGECDIGTQDAALEGSLPLIRGFEEQGLLAVYDVAGTVYEHFDFNLTPVEGYSGASATLTDADGGLLFQNPDFRKAIAHCIDRQAIVDGAANGAGFVQHTYTAANHPLYPGDDAISIYEHDPERGLELLAGLGWTLKEGDEVLTDAAGNELTFIHSTRQNPLREKITQITQAQLADNCNIKTEIELVGSEYFSDGPDGPVFGRKYDMGEFAWLTGVEPPCNLYISSQLPSEELGWGGANNVGFQNADFDAACNAAMQTLDAEVKAEQHTIAMQIFTEELPSIPIYARAKLAVARPQVKGLIMDPTANSELFNVENFDIEQ